MNAPQRFVCLLFAVAVLAPLSAQDKPDALKIYRQGRDLEAAGRAEDATQRYDQAVTICKDEITQNAANMDSYAVLSWALLRQKKYAETIEWAQKGLKVTASDYRLLEAMGEAYFYQDNYRESLKALQKYTDAAPQGEKIATAYFFMGEIYRIQKKNMLAEVAFTTAVKLEPSLSLWWYRLGQARENVGDNAQAVTAYERALALKPGYKEAADGLDRAKRKST